MSQQCTAPVRRQLRMATDPRITDEIGNTPLLRVHLCDGAILLARQRRDQDPAGYFMPDQYNNDANWRSHYDGTGLEIWEQTGGRVTHFIAGLGTSGTFMGSSRRLKELNPTVRCVSVEP